MANRKTYSVELKFDVSIDSGEIPVGVMVGLIEDGLKKSAPSFSLNGTDWFVGDGSDFGGSKIVEVSVAGPSS